MKKEVIGEVIPHNAVEFVVSSERNKYGNDMFLTFKGVVGDPQTMETLEKALDASSVLTPFSRAMSKFSMTDCEGTTVVYDTSTNWGRPKIEGDTITFSCWGSAFIAESVAEMFEMYLHSISGTYCYVVPQ